MRGIWQRVQLWPIWLRWPIKWLILALVALLVLYPNPALLVRHVGHVRTLDALPDPDDPALAQVAARFDAFLADGQLADPQDPGLLRAVQDFVHQEVPYQWDWQVWGVADYVPTLAEVIAGDAEDCDGRAVLATALLRTRNVNAQIVGDPRHYWVRTPAGDTMNPLGDPAFTADEQGIHVRWSGMLRLGSLAFAISVFPLVRELIILVTLWLLLLPPAVGAKRAGIAAALFLEALVFVRLAGSDPLMPRYAGIYWGFLHLLVAGIVLYEGPQKRRKHTARSVFL